MTEFLTPLLFFCTLVCKQGRLHSNTSDTLGKAISACEVSKKVFQFKQALQVTELKCKSRKMLPTAPHQGCFFFLKLLLSSTAISK